jgi:DNA-directed RNA polymerase II subunit RPB1
MSAKRFLTSSEIQECLNFVLLRKQVPYEIAKTQQENIQNILRKQLEQVNIYPSQIPSLKETIERKFLTTQISAGSMVGALAATSIGEPMTQLVLNSFHSSGISKSNVTTGVPRMEELINVSTINKMCGMKLYFKDSDHTDVVTLRNICKQHIEHVTIQSIVEKKIISECSKLDEIDEYKNIDKNDWNDWHDYHSLMISDTYKTCNWCVILKINKTKLFQIKKTLTDIAEMIDASCDDVYSIASDENACLIISYINLPDLENIDDIEKKKYKNKSLDLSQYSYINNENKHYYYIRDIILPDIFAFTISGVEDVTECFFDQPPGVETANGKKCWLVNTRGSNFREMLNNPFIDHTRTMTSRLKEIEHVLGIEAARTFLINEFSSIISSSKRHIEQLVNTMCWSGKIKAANRHGIENSVGIMAKLSFEQPLKNVIHASMKNENDTLNGISSQLMLGKYATVGTGYVNLVSNFNLSMDKINNNLVDTKELVNSDMQQTNDKIIRWEKKGKRAYSVVEERKQNKTEIKTKTISKKNKRTTLSDNNTDKTRKVFTGFQIQEKNIFKTPVVQEKQNYNNIEEKIEENKQVLDDKKPIKRKVFKF